MDWQPIETAPKDGTSVDLWVDYGTGCERYPDCYWINGKWYDIYAYDGYSSGAFLEGTPTHWMPLPDPPEVKT